MSIKISDYVTDSANDGFGIRFVIDLENNGFELNFKYFQELINDSIMYNNISGITFNNIDDSNLVDIIPYIKFATSIRLNVRVVSDILFEQIKDNIIMKYIDTYYDGREIDVQESRRKGIVVKEG